MFTASFSLTKFITLTLITAFFFANSSSMAATPENIVGDWEGFIEVPGAKIPTVLHIGKDDTGFSGSLDSPAQGAYGLKASEITFVDNVLKLEVPVVAGTYQGVLDPKSGTLTGTWGQGGGNYPLKLVRAEGAAPPPPARPQTPEPPYPYVTEDLLYLSRDGDTELGGTLTRPKGTTKAPAFILLSGSGSQDRDHTVMGHKTFLVLADFLTRNGYAVLRTDDRQIGSSKGDAGQAGLEALTLDALGAFDLLAKNPAIDAEKIGLIGISQGGMVAIHTTSVEPEIAALILLSSPLRGYQDVIPYQVGTMNRAAGASEQVAMANADLQRRIMKILISQPTPAEGGEKVVEFLVSLGVSENEAEKQVSAMILPAYYSFVDYDPAADLVKSNIPVLAIYGGKDTQVSAIANTIIIKELAANGRGNMEVNIITNLNHLLQKAETGLVEEYATIEETIRPTALKSILAWLKEDK